MKLCCHCKKWKPETAEYFHRTKTNKGGFYAACKECTTAGYYEERPRRLATMKRWREVPDNKEAARKNSEAWREQNRERDRASSRDWAKANPARHKMTGHRYRARKRGLPNHFTIDDWRRALDYFHGCCAVCGRQLHDLFGERIAAADHWIPLASPDCPGTVPTNMLPLCHGVDGCNSRKRHKNPKLWLIERYGERHAQEILKRVETYFADINSLSNQTDY